MAKAKPVVKTPSKTLGTLTMAITGLPQPQVERLPQCKYIDSIRWLPPLSPFQKCFAVAFFDADTSSSSLEIYSLNQSKTLSLLSSSKPPHRISSLKCASSLIAASTFSGSLHIFRTAAEKSHGSLGLESQISLADRGFHMGCIGGVDLMEGGTDCVTVGEDGRVNLVKVVGEGSYGKGDYRRIFDGNGLVSYSSVKWASPSEFVTGGCGFGLQWWDLRRPHAAVAQFKGNWHQGTTSGIIHAIDIHPSRKHTCLAGGSSGRIFAWDVRCQQQPIILSDESTTHSLSESDIWEVKFDSHSSNSSKSNLSSSRMLPAMICSEDGILGVIEQGEEPKELLAEACAINSFDIDRQNPSDVICGLEWESIALVSRP